MAGIENGSTLFAGDVSQAAIYEISQGLGLTWKDHLYTEVLIGGKPRQLTRAEHGGDPIRANVANPVAADFVGTSGVVIDGRQLSVTPLMVPEIMPILTWKDTFPVYQPNGLNIDLKLSPAIQKTALDLVMEATKTQINRLHSMGDTGSLTPADAWYDGFQTLIIADADATQVGTPAVLTITNILAATYELRNAVAPRLRFNPDLKIFCSTEDYDLYDQARRQTQTQMAYTDLDPNPQLPQAIGARINLIPIVGIPKDFMFATIASTKPSSNLVQGVWMEEDIEAFQVYKMTPADQDFKILLRFDIGVQYKTGKDIWYLNAV